MIKLVCRIMFIGFLSFGLIFNGIGKAAAEESINEKFGLPIVVYGETLTESQKDEVRDLLKVKDASKVEEIIVTAAGSSAINKWKSKFTDVFISKDHIERKRERARHHKSHA